MLFYYIECTKYLHMCMYVRIRLGVQAVVSPILMIIIIIHIAMYILYQISMRTYIYINL